MKSTINISKCIIFFLALLLIMLSYNLIYSIYLLEGIENIGRTLVILILVTMDIILINESIKTLKNRKRGKRHIFLIFLLLIYLILNAFLGLLIRKIYNNIDSMNKNNITYSTIVLALKDNNINDLNNKKIGILNDEASIDNYILAY